MYMYVPKMQSYFYSCFGTGKSKLGNERPFLLMFLSFSSLAFLSSFSPSLRCRRRKPTLTTLLQFWLREELGRLQEDHVFQCAEPATSHPYGWAPNLQHILALPAQLPLWWPQCSCCWTNIPWYVQVQCRPTCLHLVWETVSTSNTWINLPQVD